MASTYGATSSSPKRTMSSTSSVNGVTRTKILLLGQRRSGKTSIKEVLFNALPPKQTFYLETTMRIVKHAYDTVIPLEIWDCPGNIAVDTLGAPLSQFSALIFVIDIRDLYKQPISKLVEFIIAAYHDHPQLLVEKLQDERIENFRQIQERVQDHLMESECEQMPYNFHLTSVYDHSTRGILESFTQTRTLVTIPRRPPQRLLRGMRSLSLTRNSQSPKAFLFDAASRLYVATDASPVDSATHNLCCDYLSMLNAFGPLYRSPTSRATRLRIPAAEPSPDNPLPAETKDRFYPSAAA
ncbi:Gtr1/RagA G protein conserved region-domain-containing protein, partial [Mycena olivaceomarginata]